MIASYENTPTLHREFNESLVFQPVRPGENDSATVLSFFVSPLSKIKHKRMVYEVGQLHSADWNRLVMDVCCMALVPDQVLTQAQAVTGRAGGVVYVLRAFTDSCVEVFGLLIMDIDDSGCGDRVLFEWVNADASCGCGDGVAASVMTYAKPHLRLVPPRPDLALKAGPAIKHESVDQSVSITEHAVFDSGLTLMEIPSSAGKVTTIRNFELCLTVVAINDCGHSQTFFITYKPEARGLPYETFDGHEVVAVDLLCGPTYEITSLREFLHHDERLLFFVDQYAEAQSYNLRCLALEKNKN